MHGPMHVKKVAKYVTVVMVQIAVWHDARDKKMH